MEKQDELKYKIIFQAKVFRSGNSAVIVIPKYLKEMYDIQFGDILVIRILEIKRAKKQKEDNKQ